MQLHNDFSATTATSITLQTKAAIDEMGEAVKGFMEKQSSRMNALEAALGRPGASRDSYGEEKTHMKALAPYLRRGDERELKALSVDVDPDGGYTVIPERSSQIITRLFDTSPMRALANIQNTTSDALEILLDTTEAEAQWVGETGARNETNTPQLGLHKIPVHEMYANPRATQKLLDDSNISIENWLLDKITKRFTRRENTAFVNGDGVAQPRGFLTYPTSTAADTSRPWGTLQYVPSGTSGDFDLDDLNDLVATLKADYRAGASWLMTRATASAVRKKKDLQGQYLWQPSSQLGQPDSLLGFPVYLAEDMPAIAANALAIAFGDFREGYTIVDRIGLRVLRDPYTDKPHIRFYTTKRVGGDVTNFDAIKLLRLSVS